jgi:hypothetical protein
VLAVAGLAGLVVVAYLAEPYTGGGPAAAAFVVSSQTRHLFGGLFLAAALAALLPRPVVVAGSLIALGWDVDQLLRDRPFRSDAIVDRASRLGLHVSHHDLAVAGVVAVVAVALWAMAVRRVRKRRGGPSGRVGAAAAAVGGAAVAVVLLADGLASLPGPMPEPALAQVVAASARQPEIVLVGVTNVRALLGPSFGDREVTVGGGGADHELVITDPAVLDDRVARLRPDAIAVGLGASVDRPAGWVPPPPWVRIATVAGSDLYIRR